MATLQKIRDKAGVLIAVVIGASLLAFILGDFLGKGKAFGSSEPIAGTIKGNDISIQEYQQKVDEFEMNTKRNNGNQNLDAKTMEGIYDQAWEALVIKYTMFEQYKMLGLSVSPEELEDMVKGKYIDPQIKQIPLFQDPNTKIFDKARVVSFLKNLDQDPSGEARASWLAFERALVQNKVATKYNTLIQKGFFPNKLEVEDQVKATNESVNLQFVMKKFSEIKDEDISFNDTDLKKYYEDNLYKFKQEESRSITYVTFDIIPSEEDEQNTKEWLAKNKEEFANEKEAIKYINLNSDEAFVDNYYAKGELPARLDTFMFSADTGAVTDIYKENGAYKIAKLIDIKELPDSAEARHILLQQSEELNGAAFFALSDSLQELLKNGADFAELAKKYSKDQGSAVKGGDLGWFQKGQMVKPFQKACFEANVGDIVVANSQFGLHIIEVQNLGVKSRKVQVGYLTSTIEASEQTETEVYNQASRFAGENRTKEQFNKAVEELKKVPRVANNLKKTDRNIAGLENPRKLIRWTYNNELNAITEEVDKYGDKYVVAMLTEIREKGTTPFDLAKTEVENYVIKEKKAALITEEFNKAKSDDLTAIAKSFDRTVEKANNITFNSYSIPGAGAEFTVIANAIYGTPNTVISPLKGSSGIFAIVASDKTVQEKVNSETEKTRLIREFGNRVNYQAVSAIKENADIIDNRLNYY